ncbi:tetratricopeptide repeat protein 24 isoform X1 [Petromyzon marinus]|uniref:Tetratricopeptide repeat protein 24 isoform X1 n=1 Tax=Petromyzon marinus TaxID=7757 RepID=A0AAJ7TX97_PETMA|nr:tetratricopeptide repeat protein 24 isoform X1 [Petromyzon marinus]
MDSHEVRDSVEPTDRTSHSDTTPQTASTSSPKRPHHSPSPDQRETSLYGEESTEGISMHSRETQLNGALHPAQSTSSKKHVKFDAESVQNGRVRRKKDAGGDDTPKPPAPPQHGNGTGGEGDGEAQRAVNRLTQRASSEMADGKPERALASFRKAYERSGQLAEPVARAACAFNLGAAYVAADQADKGLQYLLEAQAAGSQDRDQRGDLLFNLGVAYEALHDPASAARCYEDALAQYRADQMGGQADAQVKLGQCCMQQGEEARAADWFLAAGRSYRCAGRADQAAEALCEAGAALLRSPATAGTAAVSVLEECRSACVHVRDNDALLARLYNELGLSFSQLQLFPAAVDCFERALPLSEGVADAARRAAVLQNMGAVRNSQGQFQLALAFHRQAASLHGELQNRNAQGQCFCNLAFACSQLGDHEAAAENYLHALQAFRDTGDVHGQWQANEGLGAAKFRLGDPEKAVSCYKQALALLSQDKVAAGDAQERIVGKLTDAIQYRVSISKAMGQQMGYVLSPSAVRQEMTQSHTYLMPYGYHLQRAQPISEGGGRGVVHVDELRAVGSVGRHPQGPEDDPTNRTAPTRVFPGTHRGAVGVGGELHQGLRYGPAGPVQRLLMHQPPHSGLQRQLPRAAPENGHHARPATTSHLPSSSLNDTYLVPDPATLFHQASRPQAATGSSWGTEEPPYSTIRSQQMAGPTERPPGPERGLTEDPINREDRDRRPSGSSGHSGSSGRMSGGELHTGRRRRSRMCLLM